MAPGFALTHRATSPINGGRQGLIDSLEGVFREHAPPPLCASLQLPPQPLQGPLLDPGYIAAADAQLLRHLPLAMGRGSEQAVAQPDHLPLLICQTPLHRPTKLPGILPGVQLLQQVLVPRHHILKRQRPSLGPRLDQLRQRHIRAALPPGTKIHQDLIFNTPGSVGCELDILIHPVGADGLDQADGANGDQVLLLRFGGVVFFARLMQAGRFLGS